MRSSLPVILIYSLAVFPLVQAQAGPRRPPGPGGKKGVPQSGPSPPSTVSTTSSSSSSRTSSETSAASVSISRSSFSTSATSSPTSQASTATTSTSTSRTSSWSSLTTSFSVSTLSIQLGNTLSRNTSFSTTSTTTSDPVGSFTTPNSVVPSLPMSSPAAEDSPPNHRTLVIVLSSVLGFIGLVVVVIIIFLIFRYSEGRTPFGHRGVSPINDEEIDSWRGTERKQQILSPTTTSHIPPNTNAASIGLATSPNLVNSPGWTWTMSPISVLSPPPPSATIPTRAPNSRAGLTDEAVPGADPYIATTRRQSSRLSKAPPGHARNKSRRSSISAKSTRSSDVGIRPGDFSTREEKNPVWYDPKQKTICSNMLGTEGTSSSPGTPLYDELNMGGLSPRPKSQPRPWESMTQENSEIGRGY